LAASNRILQGFPDRGGRWCRSCLYGCVFVNSIHSCLEANSSQTHQTARGLRRCQKKRFKLTASVTTDKRPNPAFCRAHSAKRKLIPTIVEILYIGLESKPNLRPMKLSRSQFLKVVGTGALSLPVISSCSSAASDNPAPAEDHSLDFGLASYTLRKFDLDG